MDSRIDFDVDEHKILLPHVICVEGNIGSGKSTLLSNLDQNGFRVIPEPVQHIWGQYLPRLYENSQRWGCSFQMEVMDWFRQLQATHLNQELKQTFKHSQALQLKKDDSKQCTDTDDTCSDCSNCSITNNDINQIDNQIDETTDNNMTMLEFADKLGISNKINDKNNDTHNDCGNKQDFIIVERSALSAFNIFSTNLYESGLMSDWEFSLLKRWYSLVMWQPKYILYLRCDPNISIKRIHQRNRNGENMVDQKLINTLHNKHEKLFIKNYGQNIKEFNINLYNTKPTKYPINNKLNNKPSLIYVNGNNDEQTVLSEAIRKIQSLPVPEPMLCNICSDCGTPRVQPRILTPAKSIKSLKSFDYITNSQSKSHSTSLSNSNSKSKSIKTMSKSHSSSVLLTNSMPKLNLLVSRKLVNDQNGENNENNENIEKNEKNYDNCGESCHLVNSNHKHSKKIQNIETEIEIAKENKNKNCSVAFDSERTVLGEKILQQ